MELYYFVHVGGVRLDFESDAPVVHLKRIHSGEQVVSVIEFVNSMGTVVPTRGEASFWE